MSASAAGSPIALILGVAGQLGGAIREGFAGSYAVVPHTRATLDVTDAAAVFRTIEAVRPAVIVNCTAYNDVEGAEEAAVRAFAVNAMAVRTLARAAERANATLVHYSTDFVFDGDGNTPYTEDALPAPQSVYGQSKLVGEWMAASVASHYLLRVESLFGGTSPRSSVDRIIDAVRAGREAKVFHDRVVSPSFVDDVVAATLCLLREKAPFGLYHCVNSGYTTWLELAREIERGVGSTDSHLVSISRRDIALKAARPAFAALDNGKLARCGCAMPPWQDAIKRYLARR